MDTTNNRGQTPYEAVTTGKFTDLQILLSIYVFRRCVFMWITWPTFNFYFRCS